MMKNYFIVILSSWLFFSYAFASESRRFTSECQFTNTELNKLPVKVRYTLVAYSKGKTDKANAFLFDARSKRCGIQIQRTQDTIGIEKQRILCEDANEVFHQILMERLNIQFESRRKNLEKACQSKKTLLARQTYLKESYLDILGEIPIRTPLNPIVTGKIECESYIIEKVVFESRPGFHVTGNFYLPKHRVGKIPGIYMMSGHTTEGKAYEAYQAAAILFAMNGFAVFITDPICQGERFQSITLEGKQRFPGVTLNHTLLDISSMLVGMDMVVYELWDNIRALDYLASRPEVDSSRLGITGNSGGGTQATYLAAYDDRVKAVAPSCYIASYEEKFETIGSQDGCQQLHDEGLVGLEEQDLLFLTAPTPVLILSAEQDFFVLEGAQRASSELKKMYDVLGYPERTDHIHHPGTHGFSQLLREAAVSWMKRWLMNDMVPVKETEDIKLQPQNDLLVTSSGQVLSTFEDEKSIMDLNIEKLKENLLFHQSFFQSVSEKELKEKVKKLLKYDESGLKKTSVILKGRCEFFGKRVDKLVVSRPGGCPLPCFLFYPEHISKESKLILLVDDQGKGRELKKDGIVETELQKENFVFSMDLSGYGELQYPKGRFWNDEFYNANLALYNGKPMFTWLVEDISCGIEGLKKYRSDIAKDIELVGKGALCPAALHATLFYEQINQLTLLKPTISSWKEVVKNPYKIKNGYAFLVPGILSYYDLPDLEKFLENRIEIKKH